MTMNITDELAEALRPFVFDWDRAVADLEDHTEDDRDGLELGVTVDRETIQRAALALAHYAHTTSRTAQQCGVCGAFLPKPKPDDRWRVCSNCGTKHEVNARADEH